MNKMSEKMFSRITVLLICACILAFLPALPGNSGVRSESRRYTVAAIGAGNAREWIHEPGDLAGILDEISPEGFRMDVDGNLHEEESLDPGLVSILHKRNIKVVPVVAGLFEGGGTGLPEERLESLAAVLAEDVPRYGLDGIHVDIGCASGESLKELAMLFKYLRKSLGADRILAADVGGDFCGLVDNEPVNGFLQELAGLADYVLIKPGSRETDKTAEGVPERQGYPERLLQTLLQRVVKTKLVLGVRLDEGSEPEVVGNLRLVNEYDIKGTGFWYPGRNNTGPAGYGEGRLKEELRNLPVLPAADAPAAAAGPVVKSGRRAYLTFDDGPDGKITPAILDLLKREHIKATFFINGIWAEKYPEIVKRMAAEGHTIGNHTYSHRMDRVYKSWDSLKGEIEKTNNIISRLTGVKCRLFRAPGGSKPYMRKDFVGGVHRLGMKIFDWNCDPKDWQANKSPGKILGRVRDTPAYKDLIIVMHSRQDRKTTLEALPGIIKYLEDKGYELLPITDETKEQRF